MLFAFRARGASLPPLMTAGKPEYELLKNAEGDPYQVSAVPVEGVMPCFLRTDRHHRGHHQYPRGSL